MNSSGCERENDEVVPDDARAAEDSASGGQESCTSDSATADNTLTSDQVPNTGIGRLLAQFGVTGEPPEQSERVVCDVCLPDTDAFLFCEDCQNNLCFGCAHNHRAHLEGRKTRHRTTHPKLEVKNMARVHARIVQTALSELERQMSRLQQESQTVENGVRHHCRDGVTMLARELENFLRIFRTSVTDAHAAMEEERQYLEEREAVLVKVLSWDEIPRPAVAGLLSFRAEDALLSEEELRRLKVIRDAAFFEYRTDEQGSASLQQGIQSFLGTVVYRPQTDQWSPIGAAVIRRATRSSTSQNAGASGAGLQTSESSGPQKLDKSTQFLGAITPVSHGVSSGNVVTFPEVERVVAAARMAAGAVQVPVAPATAQRMHSAAGTSQVPGTQSVAVNDCHTKMYADLSVLQEQQASLLQDVSSLHGTSEQLSFHLSHLQISNSGVQQTISRLVLENQRLNEEITSLREQLARAAQDQARAASDTAFVKETMCMAERHIEALEARLQGLKQSQAAQIKAVKGEQAKLQKTLEEVQQSLTSSQVQLATLQQLLTQLNTRRDQESAATQVIAPSGPDRAAISRLEQLRLLLTSPGAKWLFISLAMCFLVSAFKKSP